MLICPVLYICFLGATEDDYEVGIEGGQSNCPPVVQSGQLSSADHESQKSAQKKSIGHITLVHCGIGKTSSGSDGEIPEADASFAGIVQSLLPLVIIMKIALQLYESMCDLIMSLSVNMLLLFVVISSFSFCSGGESLLLIVFPFQVMSPMSL